jgi:oligoribonuclease NrnB/cAMP/cGMP phosphodiesterase (DHH superfamily)
MDKPDSTPEEPVKDLEPTAEEKKKADSTSEEPVEHAGEEPKDSAEPEPPTVEVEAEVEAETDVLPTEPEEPTEVEESKDVPPEEPAEESEPAKETADAEPSTEETPDKDTKEPTEPSEPSETVEPDSKDTDAKTTTDDEPETDGEKSEPELVAPEEEPTVEDTQDSGEMYDADEIPELDDEDKKPEYDFFPTRDTLTVITNLDVDGVLCIAALNKMINSEKKVIEDSKDITKLRVFFTSPPKIFSTLSKSIPDLNKIDDNDFTIGQLYICDLSLHRDTLLGSSIYDNVKWFDHHEIDPDEQFDTEIESINLIIDSSADSTTSVICDYFKLDNELAELANEVDSNNALSDNAVRLRELIGALRHNYSGPKLKTELFELAKEISKNISAINNEVYNPAIEEYKKWLDEFKKIIQDKFQVHELNGHKIGILETENAAPVYSIYDDLKSHSDAPFDLIAVMVHKYYRLGRDKNNKFKNKKYTKIEFRTQTDKEIIELAKVLGGGGHKYASGTTIHDGMEKEELYKTIESYFGSAPTDNSEDKEKLKE